MMFQRGAAVITALFVCLAQGVDPSTDNGGITESSPPRGYILEYDGAAHLKAKRDEVFSERDIEVLKHFDSPIFSGAQIAAGGHDLDELSALPGVARAWLDEEVTLLVPIDKRQQPAAPEDAAQHDVHWATGVHELHERGVLGKDVKIGIIDTGIWYSHSALGGGFGPGYKAAGGWDFVGDNWVPGAARNPDADPADEQGHGTHVAGIIAGDAETGWKGVAPEASLYAYKVFGTSSSTDNSIIIEAFLKAYEDGMDIITASLGSASGFPDNPLAVVANRIAAEGVVVTVAAGNSGTGGPFFASNGGAGDLTLSVASADVARRDSQTTLQPSSFTSWGALYDLSVKPDIAAPGRDVFSAWIGSDNNSYRLVSGTSMATPYVAGVAALYLSVNGGRNVHGKGLASNVNMRIISSGTSLDSFAFEGGLNAAFKASTYEVGAGLVNALKVVDSTFSLDLQRFALNDTRRTRRHQDVTIRNDGDIKLSFTFDLEAAAGYELLQNYYGTDFPTEFPRIKAWRELSPISAVAGIKFPDKFELGPGKSGKARFVFDVPQGLNASALPMYSGKVLIKASNDEQLSVPFQGLGFDLKGEMENMFSGTYPWLRAGFPPQDQTTFNLDQSLEVQSYPKIFSKLKWGTRELRWDIYETGFEERHWRHPPVVGEQGYIGAATSWAYGPRHSMFNPARHNASDLIAFPLKDQTRNALVSLSFTSSYYWFGKLANGTLIAPGNYTMRYAALKPFSEPARSDSWDVFTKDITLTHTLD